jgi:hypothetical protein
MPAVQHLSGALLSGPPAASGEATRLADLTARLPRLCRSTSDETRTSTVSPTLLNGMSFTVEANSVYAIDGCIFWQQAATGVGLRVGWGLPSGCSGAYGFALGGVGTQIGNEATETASVTSARLAMVRGVLVVGATAGTVEMRFAQATSSTSALTLRTHTWLLVTKQQ